MVEAQTVDAKRIELHASDFTPKAQLVAFVQGCETETTQTLSADARGEVHALLTPAAKARCAFTCDVDASPLVVALHDDDQIVRSREFPCWKKGAAAPKPLLAWPKPATGPRMMLVDAFNHAARAPLDEHGEAVATDY
jgi:hypothetical protein